MEKQYEKAIDLLKESIKKDKKFVEAYFELAIIYKNLEKFKQAEQLLDKAKIYIPAKDVHLHYKISHLYYRIGAYKKAKTAFQRIPTESKKPKLLQAKIYILQQNLSLALEKIQRPLVFNPRKLPTPLNQFASQYFPVLTVDQQTILFTALVNYAGRYRENIYISYKDKFGKWTVPTSISEQINGITSNEGTCTISADKRTLVFTSCSREGNYGVCDLYISYRKGTEWTKPQNLGPHINSKGWQSQPSLSADGKILYFVSERKGNYGKNDIWKSTLQTDGQWSKPVNLGPVINSKAREISPFIHPNGQTLFFASNRTPSMGGFDIYYSNLVNGEWTEPINLGYPINNHKDQASIFITADGKKGYYADGKRKDCNYHKSYIYEFDMPDNLILMPKSNTVKLKVLDAKTEQPIVAQVEVYDMDIDTCQQHLTLDSVDGEATITINADKEYLVHISKDGHLFEIKYISYKNQDHSPIISEETVVLQPIEINQTKILKNVYFKYDEYSLNKKSYIELDRLVAFLKTNPDITIELEGHTDHIGSDEYNQQLSTKRAKAIYEYLLQAGIANDRVNYKGYGKTRPIAPNDSQENQQLNRRVAFRITRLRNS
ncbi:OmpA family protein [Candidatus Amoebophilus asiaticus]|uniref:OmpA family protein n=1 Tax=Candidatus Amoebophilus asiaticus TaxID=281120 RepID=UPI0002DE398E|nr:OmpA family protein [Candidatus Amoebophilus asiaticus]